MASELATQLEPLIQVASMSLMDVNAYLTTVTGVELDYDIITRQQREILTRPLSAFVRTRSVSEEPTHLKKIRQRYQMCVDATAENGLATPVIGNMRTTSPGSIELYSSSGSINQHSHHPGHRNSVGSIDTETFGKLKKIGLSSYRPIHVMQPTVVDASYGSPHNNGMLGSVQPSPWSGSRPQSSNYTSSLPTGSSVLPCTSNSLNTTSATARDSISPLS